MIMVWSGWGIQVPLYVVAAFFLAMMGIAPLHLAGGLDIAASAALTGAIAGGAVYFTARAIESKPGRTFIDAGTNQSFEVKPSAGSFFFIPTRYWAFIIPLLAFLFAGSTMMDPDTPAPVPTPASNSATPS